jgi:hypothetical protein
MFMSTPRATVASRNLLTFIRHLRTPGDAVAGVPGSSTGWLSRRIALVYTLPGRKATNRVPAARR